MVSRKDKAQAEMDALIAARKIVAEALGAVPLGLITEHCNGDVPIQGIRYPCANQKLEDGSLCQGPCRPSIHYKMEVKKGS